MELIQITLLALLQGLTEFLPISSSAHLILFPQFTDWSDQGIAFDVAVHLGTLSAVIIYFRHDLKTILADFIQSLIQRKLVGESRLAWAVGLGTIPVGIAGLLFKDYIEVELRSPQVIAWATVVFALLLWWADRLPQRTRDEHRLTWKDIVVIGIAQAIALIPGTSRSGITMTAGLMMGLTRTAAARFSFLLSIPVIILAGGLNGIELAQQVTPVDWNSLIIGTVISAISAYLCIHFFLKLLERVGMLPFVIYRLFLAAILFAIYGL
ncbi:MAG: undecaprenyl-diphosphate phosphatase [Gammaproteobacteria bacterium]|nr:undecaprenyl-diphosphate phosphatase [Gammaproteobacteria bacterium]